MNNRRSKQLRQKQMLLRVIVLAYLTCASADICPNACSGHGTCQSSSTSIHVNSNTAVSTAAVCTCDAGYLFPDCSGLACPTGLPWFSAATADGTARGAVQECSGIGLCDYKTGLCTCPTVRLPDRKPAALGKFVLETKEKQPLRFSPSPHPTLLVFFSLVSLFLFLVSSLISLSSLSHLSLTSLSSLSFLFPFSFLSLSFLSPFSLLSLSSFSSQVTHAKGFHVPQ